MVRRDSKSGIWGFWIIRLLGLNLKLTPQGVDIFLLVIHAGVLHKVVSSSGMSSVCANQEVEFDFDFGRRGGRAMVKPGKFLFEISPDHLVVEEEFDVGH